MIITILNNQYILDALTSDFVYLRPVFDGVAYWPGIKINTVDFINGWIEATK